jgi:hypothetical protein
MSSRNGSEAKARAYDHYRWAERYSRYGDEAKAKAHMRRAVHYGKAAFGTGPETGAAPVPGPEKEVDIIFVLSPLNDGAVQKIMSSINQSTTKGKQVEVYIQAFTKKDGIGAFTAPNLTPMNFNQYSSDNPLALVEIINSFKSEQSYENVHFYIFPTQTTKNATFNTACTTALRNLVLNTNELRAIDDWMKAAIIAWGIKEAKNADKTTDIVESLKFTDLKGDVSTYLPNWTPQAVFDPFCVYWAVDKQLSGRSKWPVKAHPTEVTVETVNGMKIPEFDITLPKEHKSNCSYVIWDQAALEAKKAALTQILGNTEATDNQIQAARADLKKVEDEMNIQVALDAADYIGELWESFKQRPRCERKAAKRRVRNMLIVQDYYDYDNKMSVWYLLYMFEVIGELELLSITRPVANRKVMSKMRKNGGAFAYAGSAPTPVQAASPDDKWPAAPVITEENFNKHVAAMRKKGVYDGPESFKDYKAAIDPLSTEALAASSKEAEEIANTWAQWLDHFYATRTDLKPKGRYTCTNGGHTNRHGLNPVMHTLMEDWFKEPEPTHPQLPKRQKT